MSSSETSNNISYRPQDVYIINPVLFRANRAHKRICLNCSLLHSSYQQPDKSYCIRCKRTAFHIFKWWLYRKNTLRMSRSILTAFIVSKCLDTHEDGLYYNIIGFL